jgi:uncharacterized membrane protein
MRHNRIIFAGPVAILLMVFYYSIPFVSVAGGPRLARLRPFLISGAVLLVALGFYQSWPSRHSKSQACGVSMAVLWFSAVVVFFMILFPETIANLLANTVGG